MRDDGGRMVIVGSLEGGRRSWGAVLDTARHFGVSPRTVSRYLRGCCATTRRCAQVRRWVRRHYITKTISPTP